MLAFTPLALAFLLKIGIKYHINYLLIKVLCAGINAHFQFEENEDMEIYEKVMKVNFFGYVFCTK